MYDILPIEQLSIPSWSSTHILRPDMLVLADSIGTWGLLCPLIVRKADNSIIDGVQRFSLILGNKYLQEKFPTGLPVTFVDCDEIDAMILHTQMNRGRGAIVAKRLSEIIRSVRASRKYTDKEISQKLSMKFDEFELMLMPTIIKQRKITEHNYSRAWVPVEAPAGTVEEVFTERPPNADR